MASSGRTPPAEWYGDTPVERHPEADSLIIPYIEHLFSRKNLRTDSHLRGKLFHGAVSVSEIASWPKLRRLRPKRQVAAAIMESPSIEVVDHIKYGHIRRAVPYIESDSSDDDDNDDAYKQKRMKQNIVVPPLPKYVKPTGLEENFVEPPIAPAEFEEELQMYSADTPVHERLEMAIQRFKTRKSFRKNAARYFNAWLKFGGIEAGQKQFTGRVDQYDLELMDAAEIARINATHFAGPEKMDDTKWEVDFEGVGKAYLSSHFTELFWDYIPEDVELQCNIMKKFYNYLLTHNVCPDHTRDIEAARSICDTALPELLSLRRFGKAIPGDFNLACSVLYAGHFAQISGQSTAWADYTVAEDPHLKTEKARLIISTGLCAHAEQGGALEAAIPLDPLNDNTWTSKLKVTDVFDLGLEITGIKLATMETIEAYNIMKEVTSSKVHLEPLGKLICKNWKFPDFAGTDLPKDYRSPSPPNASYTFWLEDSILQNCFKGMKIDCKIRRLAVDGGTEAIWLLDEVNRAYCSFYNYILNELMDKDYKPIFFFESEEAAAQAEKTSDGLGGSDGLSDLEG